MKIIVVNEADFGKVAEMFGEKCRVVEVATKNDIVNLANTGESLQQHVVNNIKERLSDLGIYQRKFASDLNTTEQTISKYMNGRTEITLSVLERMAAALGTTAAALVK